MAMEVEEDPSSQFVDFTNATALEQFVSDVEQTLIAWQLSNKGHASPEALSAALSPAQQQQQSAAFPALDEPLTWTRVLELESFSGSAAKSCYALTLFARAAPRHSASSGSRSVSPAHSSKSTSSRNRLGSKPPTTKWQQGLEHFTPTMLSIADTSRDFHWHSWRRRQHAPQPLFASNSSSTASATGNSPRASSASADNEAFYDTAAFATAAALTSNGLTLDDAQRWNKRATFESVQKWFGVDAFVFLSRTTQRASKKPTSAMHRVRSAPSVAASGDDGDSASPARSATDELGSPPLRDQSEDEDASEPSAFLLDVAVDQNEAALLLSALTIALNNCNCTLPAFVPTFEPSRGAWLGSAVPGATGNVSIAFETDSIPEVSSNQSCISGLLDFFKLKLQLPYAVEETYRSVVSSGNADDVPIGMLVSASFGYTWTRSEDPREVEAEHSLAPSLAQYARETAALSAASDASQRVVQALYGDRWRQCVGATASPLIGLDLTVIWPNLREGTYVDNVVHSTLDAKKAPEWMLEARFQRLHADNARKPQLALSKGVANLVQAYANSRELSKDLLVAELAPNLPYSASAAAAAPSSSGSTTGSAAVSSASAGSAPLSASTATSRLHDAIPAARAAVVIGNAIGTLTSSLVSAATWKGTDVEEIRRTVLELFDDAVESEKRVQMASSPVTSTHAGIAHSAPIGELVSILACRMGQLHGLSAMSLLWVEFVKMLRERWFQLQLLPAMSTAMDRTDGTQQSANTTRSLDALFLLDSTSLELPPPDFHQCLLHQKLQLLNCCILRQAEHTRAAPPSPTQYATTDASRPAPPTTTASDLTAFTFEDADGSTEDSPASDDEFFDSIEQHDAASTSTAVIAEGVRRPVPGVVCLTTNAVVMEPITQVAVPMTEDVAKEQQELLARLGGSAESATLRQQLQSAALVSDMQAFKAANPGCVLADFIRWYSPKDWIPFDPLLGAATEATLPRDGQGVWWFAGHGMLSDRMRFSAAAPGAAPSPSPQPHLWQQMWASAAPVPVARQRCLFDPLHESEKIYHYLETISPHELFHQMLAGALASAVYTLETALPVSTSALPVFHTAMQTLRGKCARAIALLDDALAESQVTFPARREQREDLARAQGQMQVAFEMALDACWKLVSELEAVEALLSHALALFVYFAPTQSHGGVATESLELVNLLLEQASSYQSQSPPSEAGDVGNGSTGQRSITELLQVPALRDRVTTLVLLNPVLAGPVQREYVLRCISPRPFLRGDQQHVESERGDTTVDDDGEDSAVEESPLVVNRMYAAFKKNTVRFALVLAESEF